MAEFDPWAALYDTLHPVGLTPENGATWFDSRAHRADVVGWPLRCEASRHHPPSRPKKGKVKRKKHTPAQIVEKLRRADILLGQQASVGEVVTTLEVSEQTYYRWRRQYGGAGRTEVRRLRELEKENARLKRIVADQALDLAMAKDVIEGKV